MMRHKRMIGALAGAALLVVTGAAVGLPAQVGAPQFTESYHASRPIYDSLDELTNKSVLVTEVRVVAVGPSYTVAADPPANPNAGLRIPQGGPNGKGAATPTLALLVGGVVPGVGVGMESPEYQLRTSQLV